MEKVNLNGSEIRLYTVQDFYEKLKEKFPDGITIPIQNVDMDKLNIYRYYPVERNIGMNGIVHEAGTRTSFADEYLKFEFRLKPDDYKMVSPEESIYFSEELEEATDLGPEDNVATMLLNQVPEVEGCVIEMGGLFDEKKFLENIYLEGIPMKEAMTFLLQKDLWSLDDFRETVQLYRLKNEGLKVLDEQVDLVGKAIDMTENVTRDYQHMYTGEGKPLEGHEYYESDIKPKYDGDLKQQAELELRKMGVIPTRPEVYDVRWKNTRGDNWECEQMTHVINDMFRGYREKVVDAVRNEDWMRVNIYTTNPEYRKRILDTITCSWAKEEVRQITDLSEMPEEIAEALQKEQERKESSLYPVFIGVKDCIYFAEKGNPGYVCIDYDRNVITQGEPLTEKNQAYVNRLAKEENILRGNGCCLSLVGDKKLYLDRMNGSTLKVSNEIIDGKIQTVEEGSHCVCNVNPIRYLDITGRITDAKVVNKDNVYLLRCKIDGEQQPGVKLYMGDAIRFKNHQITTEQLAVHIHALELIDRSNNQEKATSMRR